MSHASGIRYKGGRDSPTENQGGYEVVPCKVCTDHYPRVLCAVYLHWFDRTTIDAAGGRFWVAWLRDNGMTTADTEFLRHFQDGCGNEDCAWMCANHNGVPYCETYDPLS